MSGLIENAGGILAHAERRMEVAAQNISNASTPGYRRSVSFASLVGAPTGGSTRGAHSETATDFAAGRLVETRSPTDLAIAGDGFFAVRAGEAILYTRGGQFERDAEGRLASAAGHVLQAADGGDLVLRQGDFSVDADGVVTVAGEPVARVALAAFGDPALLRPAGGGAFTAGDARPGPRAGGVVHQGMLEMSNVDTGDEMVAMMEALRRAETGQRLATTYDELMGRALGIFGQQS